MAFRKLQFKNVQGTRASQTIQAGELALDETTNQLYVGDGSTAGGVAVGPGSKTITYTTSVNTSGTNIGDAPDALISDNGAFERIIVTNSSGVAQRITIPSINAIGKMVSIEGSGGTQDNITCDAASRQGDYTVETLSGYNVLVMVWTGADWVNIG